MIARNLLLSGIGDTQQLLLVDWVPSVFLDEWRFRGVRGLPGES